MARIRTFIAVDLGKVIRDRLVSLQEQLAKAAPEVKWVEPQNLHVTLLFLGEVDDREIHEVCRTVDSAAQTIPAFSLSVEGTGCFPNIRRPRVLWAGIRDGADDMVRLHDALETPLLELGCYRREERKFTPHVTIGRFRGEGPKRGLDHALAAQLTWKGGAAPVHEVQVMSSELTPQGPLYTVLGRGRLGS